MLLQGRQETMGRGGHCACPNIAKAHNTTADFLFKKTCLDTGLWFSCLGFQCASQKLKVFGNLAILDAQFLNAFDAMHHGGVVTTPKAASNFR